jgi:hypothetical protein
VDLPPGEYKKIYDIDVHGGITFDRRRYDGSGRIGFECSHVGDWIPQIKRIPDEVYRNFEFVRREVEKMAQQLAAKEVSTCPDC